MGNCQGTQKFIYVKYMLVNSCYVERTFFPYKNVLMGDRMSFTIGNLCMYTKRIISWLVRVMHDPLPHETT